MSHIVFDYVPADDLPAALVLEAAGTRLSSHFLHYWTLIRARIYTRGSWN